MDDGAWLSAPAPRERVGWVERSDTHQLHLMEMMGFAGSTHPTCSVACKLWSIDAERQLVGPAMALMGYERCIGTKQLNHLEAIHRCQS